MYHRVDGGRGSTDAGGGLGETRMVPLLAVRREVGGVADYCTGISEADLESSVSRQASLLER